MKLQNFSVIFIVIILPIALVLSIYTGNLISVANQQSSYDSILLNSTYDAVRAYQMNTLQNSYDSETNSKVRDINASINTFFNSLSLGLSSSGYAKEDLTDYIPAMLYTLYDGYYVYGVFDNIVNTDGELKYNESGTVNKKQYGLKPYIYYSCEYADKYGNYDLIVNYTLDNYITVTGTYFDSETNKKVNIAESGYYVNYNNMTVPTSPAGPATFEDKIITLYQGKDNEVKIAPEQLGEYLITIDESQATGNFQYNLITDAGKAKYYNYIIYNGVKYYLDRDHINADGTPLQATKNGNVNSSFNITYDSIPIFFLDRDTRIYISQSTFNEIKSFLGVNEDSKIYSGECFKDVNAYYYYYRADKFSRSVENALRLIDLGTEETIDDEGHVIKVIASNSNDINNAKNVIKTETYHTNYTNELGVETHVKTTYSNPRIFSLDDLENDPELQSSSFNLHRMDVIISSIESSLVSTIANFNNYTGGGFVYTMPVINEVEWDQICNNISLLSFMQGLTIGNYKYYSSYSLITNTKTKDFISKDAIFVQNANGSGEYHNPKCLDYSNQNPSSVVGYVNIDYDRQDCIWIGHEDNIYYYYLQGGQGAYECIVGQNGNQYSTDEIIKGEVLEGSKNPVNGEVRRAYITALARERGNSYKTYGFLNEELQIKSALAPNEALYTIHYFYQDFDYASNTPKSKYHEIDYKYSSTSRIGTLITNLNCNKTPNIGYKYLGDSRIKIYDYNSDQYVFLNDSNNKLQNNTRTDVALFFDVDMTKTKPLYYDVEYYVWNDGEARYNLRETKRKGENKWVNAKTQLDVDIPDYYNDSKLIYTDPRMYEVGGQTISTGSTIKAYYASNYEYVDKTYTIRYHTTQGEGVMENSIYKFFENNLLSANKFVYSGNKFKGWALAKDGEVVYSDRDSVVFANDTNLTKDNGNYYLDLYAIWETGVYQVQYNPNGATSGTMENTVHKFNETSKLGKNQYSKDYTLTLNVGANNTNFYKNSFGNWGKTQVNYDEQNNEYTMIVPENVEKYDGFFYTRNDAIIESGKTVTISYDVYSDKEITLGLKVQNQIVGSEKDSNTRKDGDNKTIINPTVIPAEEWTTIYFTYKNNSQNSIYDYSVLAVDESNGNTNVIIKNPRLEKTNLKTVINDENITAVVSSRFLNWISESNRTYYDEQEIVNLTNESGKIIGMTAKWESVEIILPEIRNEGLKFMGWKDDAGNDIDLSKPLNVNRNMTLTASFKDDIPPEVKVDVLDTTPNTITVQASATDKGMGMNNSVQYMYYIKEKNELNYTEYNGGETQTFKFENLKQGTEYDIKVVAISDKAGNNGEGSALATTNNFTGTIYVEKIDWISSEDDQGKAMVRFATKDLSDSTFYLECKKESDEEWTVGNTVFDVENEETVFARLTDGANVSQSISIKVQDQIKPNITIESNTSIMKAYNTINIYIKAEDNETGLPKGLEYKYLYKKESENNYITGTTKNNNISIENLEQNTIYDIIVEVSDYAGNKNRASIKVKTSYKYDLIFDAGLSAEVTVEGSMGKWECYKDVTYIIPECGFKAEGYKFLHWKIGNEEYNPKDEVINLSKNGENVTLTAVWEKQEEQNPQGQ